VTIEILDGQNAVVNTYSSETPAGAGGRGRGGRGGAPPAMDSDDAEAGSGGGRSGRGNVNLARVTKTAGMNRFVWDVRHQSGFSVPPGGYQVRLRVNDRVLTQPLTVLIDPNVAADGVTVADLKEQFEHNLRVRDLATSVNQTIGRLREAQGRFKGGQDIEKAKQVELIAGKLLTQPVRYGRPGLQAHVPYLASMTSRGDQKIGRDAVERYAELKKELDAVNAELSRVLGQ
jgi:hypothetical protein